MLLIISDSDIPVLPELHITSSFSSNTLVAGGIGRQPLVTTEEACQLPFEVACAQPGCTDAFGNSANLEQHVQLGIHSFHRLREMTKDRYKRLYLQSLEMVQTQKEEEQEHVLCSDHDDESEVVPVLTATEMGNALPVRKKPKRKTVDQLLFLKELFERGIQNRSLKVTGDATAKLMRSSLKDGGMMRFTPEEYLSPQQCTQYFSQQSSKVKKGTYKCISERTAEILEGQFGIRFEQLSVVAEVESELTTQQDESLDPDYEAALVAAETDDAEVRMTMMNGSLSVMPGQFCALETEHDWTIAKVLSVDGHGESESILLEMMKRSAEGAHSVFTWCRGKNSAKKILGTNVVAILPETPERTAKGKHSFTLSEATEMDIVSCLQRSKLLFQCPDEPQQQPHKSRLTTQQGGNDYALSLDILLSCTASVQFISITYISAHQSDKRDHSLTPKGTGKRVTKKKQKRDVTPVQKPFEQKRTPENSDDDDYVVSKEASRQQQPRANQQQTDSGKQQGLPSPSSLSKMHGCRNSFTATEPEFDI